MNTGDQCLVSLQLRDRVLHIIGYVRRKELGDDDRYYLGIEYDRLPGSELDRIREHACGETARERNG